MLSFPRRLRVPCGVLVVGVVALVVACKGSPLKVNDPTITVPGALTPNTIGTQENGVIGDFHSMFDWYSLYSGLLTDEFVLAGTFPTRVEIDERRPNYVNNSINPDTWQPMSVSRASADQMVSDFSGALANPDFAGVTSDLQHGIDLGRLLGGWDRILFSQLFCQSIFGGASGESAPVLPADRMAEARDLLAKAAQSSDPDIQAAAIVGEAHAQMFLKNYSAASSLAQNVPAGFSYVIDYSTSTIPEENHVYTENWGADTYSLRWTIGNGTDVGRHLELFPYYNEWVSQGLIIPPDQNTKTAFNQTSPVSLETLYNSGAASMVLASGWEAQMIIAEAQYRAGNMTAAASTINALLTDPNQTDNPMHAVNSSVPNGAFQAVSFTGDLTHDLNEIGRAREAGLWLTGDRQGALYRWVVNDKVDFYPTGTTGDALQLPIPSDEVNTNPNLSKACPPGTPGVID